ncbi:MAG: hypothetical protein CSA82_03695 [Actinobacteria bacterium]|nr:MAG: hypothetical protein CSA82_03695 [Actinomycetota bacterium]
MASQRTHGGRRWLRRVPAVVVLLASALIVFVALFHQGVATAEVDVDDGGIWVTNESLNLVGHLNYEARTLDSALRTESSDFDISQFKETVTFSDQALSSVAPVEVAGVQLGTATSLPEGTLVAQGGHRLAVLDPIEGNLWVAPAEKPSSTTYTEEFAVATDLEGAALTASESGAIFAVTPDGRIVSVIEDGEIDRLSTTEITGLSNAPDLAITAVGDTPIALDKSSNTLILPDGSLRSLSDEAVATGGRLQLPGPDASSVLLATDTSLVDIPLDGGSVVTHPATETGEDGAPANPVRHRGCAYSAWAGSGASLRICDDDSANQSLIVDTLKTAGDIRFRTNRTRIVLNDIGSGSVWLPDNNMVLMDDWEQIDSELKKKETPEDSPQITNEIADPERREQNTPPEAVDDSFGVRPGRTTTLPVLSNDSDADGDVLTARPVTQPEKGTIVPTRGGRALQISGFEEPSGSVSFVYEASDGKAVDTASVKVDIHPWDVNDGPQQLRDPEIKLGANAQIEYNVLTDWIDPDGDPFFLQSASAPDRIEVQFRKEGILSIRDLGAEPGPYTIGLEVSDGQEVTSGTLTVHVQPVGNLQPIANADFYVIPVNEPLNIEPLANDTDPNGDQLKLVAVSPAPEGVVLTPDLELGSINFTARAKGSYQFTYTATDGPSTALGVVRVDVVDVDAQAPPVAEDDLAVLPAGGSVTVAPLDNDSDPSGGVLVVQRIEVPENSGLEVTLVDRHLLRISASGGLDGTVSIPYIVSNGVSTATAVVTVVPTDALDDKEPPRLQPDRAKVRVGDIASVHVLANDMSPAGLAMRVEPKLEFTPNPDVGTPFVTGNLVRLEAGNKPGVMHVAYTVRDSAGNIATSTVLFEVRPLEGTNAAPQPKSLTAWAVSGQTSRIPVPLNGIDPDGDSVTLIGVEQSPTKGSVELGVEWLEYTPAEKTVGTDVFTYIVEDREGKQATARVRVGIAPPAEYNQNPIAAKDTVRVRPERHVDIAVLTNDIDADGDSVSLVEGSLVTNEERLKPQISGSVITVTTPPQEGSYIVSYGISDGRGGTATGTLTVNVSQDAPLLPPIARDDVVALAELPDHEGVVKVKVLSNDEDPDGDSQELKVSSSAAGVVVEGKELVITPDTRRRVVVYTVTDVDGLSSSAIVSVPGIERTRPVLDDSKVPVEVRAGQEVILDIADYVITRPGRSARIVDETSVKAAVGISPDMTVEDGRKIRFQPEEDFSGKSAISFEVRDGAADDDSALSAVLTIPLRVIASVNTPPTFTPTPVSVSAGDEGVTLNLAEMVKDPDGQDPSTFAYSLGATPDGVTVTLDGSKLLVRARVDQAKGPVGSITVAVDDGSGAVQALIPVTVVSSTRPLIQVSDALVNAANAGGQEVIDLTQYTINPFPDTPLRIVGAQVQVGEGTVDPQGTLLRITPAAGFHGQMTVVYRLMDATGDQDRIVEGNVRLVVRDRPAAPTNVSLAPTGPGRAMVSFQPGTDNGAPITKFTLTDIPTGQTYECQTASCPVEGLTNGMQHSFSVIAHNDVGPSPASEASAGVLIDVRPSQPAPPTAQAGDGQVTVTWTPPANEGSQIEGYTLLISGENPQEITLDGNQTSYTVDGLRNGTAYRFSVSARNRSPEPSPLSELSSAAIPYGPPPPPQSVDVAVEKVLNATEAQMRVTWTLPADSNGRPIDRVRVKFPGMNPIERSISQGNNSLVQNLPAQQGQSVEVSLGNSEGQWSPPVRQGFNVYGLPAAPTSPSPKATGNNGEVRLDNLSVVPGNGYSQSNLRLEWTPEGQDSWAPVPSSRIINLPGNGSQRISIRQVGNNGSGETAGESISLSVHPVGPPSAPSIEASIEGQNVIFRWSLPANNTGQEMTGLNLTVNGQEVGGVDLNSTEHRVTNAEPGKTYTAQVTLIARDGSRASSQEATVTMPGVVEGQAQECRPEIAPPPPEGQPGETPAAEPCYELHLKAHSWGQNVGILQCDIRSDVTDEVSSFRLRTNDTWSPTGVRMSTKDQDIVNSWFDQRISCVPE